jgi:CRP-like cAMP-binding protein
MWRQKEETMLIRRFFTMGRSQTFSKGETLLGNDQYPDGVYFISTGYVKIFSISDSGDEYLHIIYGHDEIFPLIWAFLGHTQESVFFEALEDTVTWRLPRDRFLDLIQTNPTLCFAISTQLARQFQIYTDRVDNLEYKKASERVAYRLLFLASRFGVRSGSKITIDAPLTHDTFANSVNLARETVSRQLELLQDEHIIKTLPQHFIIMDIPALVGKMSRPNNIKNWEL